MKKARGEVSFTAGPVYPDDPAYAAEGSQLFAAKNTFTCFAQKPKK